MTTLNTIFESELFKKERDIRSLIRGNLRADGLYIKFNTKDNITTNNYVEIDYNNKKYYFEVVSVQVNEESDLIEARETGYWSDRLSRNDDICLGELFGIDVSIIKDKYKIEKIIDDAYLL